VPDNSAGSESHPVVASVPFDFRRQERVTKPQIDFIRSLHETFVETFISSLTFYLRSNVSGSLVKVEQMPFGDFAQALPSPTCVVYLTMQPYQGCVLVEISHSLLGPILDQVLGGNGTIRTELNREITKVEEAMLETCFGILAQDLTETWRALAGGEFVVEGLERKPNFSNRIPREEAVMAIRIELQVAGAAGVMNVVIPSSMLQILGQRVDQQKQVLNPGSAEMEQRIASRLCAQLHMDVELTILGAGVKVADLLAMRAGDVLDLGVPCTEEATVLINGCAKFNGELVAVDNKRSVLIRLTIRSDH
jgi:flagellar motor switch protein FliM